MPSRKPAETAAVAETAADTAPLTSGTPPTEHATETHRSHPKDPENLKKKLPTAREKREERAAAYDKRDKPVDSKTVKEAAREERRKKRFIEKGY
jgi:hypothetical protein